VPPSPSTTAIKTSSPNIAKGTSKFVPNQTEADLALTGLCRRHQAPPQLKQVHQTSSKDIIHHLSKWSFFIAQVHTYAHMQDNQ
jgi:hypothetical protein